MKTFKTKLLSLLCAMIMLAPLVPQLPYTAEASLETLPPLSLEKCKKAEISLREQVTGVNFELIDGGSDDPNKETFNALNTYNGEVGREVGATNKMNFKFSEEFAAPEDDLFLFAFRYWDYGGGGKFYLDYSSMDGPGTTTRVEVAKRGLLPDGTKDVGAWRWEYVIVAGAQFTRSLDTGADFKIANRAPNCFTDMIVYNLEPIADEVALLELGTFAADKTKSIFNFGLLPEYEKVADAQAAIVNKLPREAAIHYTVKFLGHSKRAEEANLECPYKDVAPEYQKTVAYAKELGIIDNETDTLGAQEIIKERELLEYYFKYLGLPTDGDIIKAAQEKKIVYGADCIFQPEKEALYDNLFAIGSNILKVNAPGKDEMIVMDLIDQGIVTFSGIIQSNDEVIMNKFLEEPFYLEPIENIDPVTQRKWYELNFFGASISRPYMTQQTFSDDNETIVFCDLTGYIFIYNIRTHYGKKIGEISMSGPLNPNYVSMTFRNGTSELYYINKQNHLCMYDVKTDKTTVLFDELPSSVKTVADVQITNDGTRMSFDASINVPGKGSVMTSAVFDIPTKELFIKDFYDFTESSGIGYYAMHTAINPVYTDVVTFASGGNYTGPGLYDSFQRMYRWNVATGEQGNFFDEYKTDIVSNYGRDYGEQNGHESWTLNGEWLIVNKASSQYKGVPYANGYPGIVLISPDGRDRKYYGEARVWNPVTKAWIHCTFTHPCGDPTGERWMAADASTNRMFGPNHWTLIMMDSESGAAYMPLARIPLGPSDYHPHPAYSQNLQYIAIGLIDLETQVGEIGWVDVSDITSVPQDGQRITLSESCETIDYHSLTENFKHDLDIIEVDGETAYKVPFGKQMFVNVFNDVIWGTNENVTFEIEYLDNGISPIKIDYVRWNGKGINQHLSERSVTIPRTGKGGWQTATVTINDINMDNTERLATDIRISGAVSDIVIKTVRAKKAE